MYKTRVDLFSEGIARLLGKVVTILEPQLVYCHHMSDDGEHGKPFGRIRLSHSYEDIISVENLLAAWREFVAGKRKKLDVQNFQIYLMDRLTQLHRDLHTGSYHHGGYTAFKISDPKPRDIHKATVQDRLMHHAIYRVLLPFFDRTFIADSYSCRKHKGTHKAMERFKEFGRKVSKNETQTCWVLKCDVRKFFASIDQEILMRIVEDYIPDEKIVALIRDIVQSFHSTESGTGLPLGNLTSQLLVNVYMNEFDQFAKHRLKAKCYIRYADDFVIFSEDRAWLESLVPRIAEFLHERLRLSLHPKKVSIGTLASGVDFLGWKHFSDHRVLRGATRRRMLRNMQDDSNGRRKASYVGMLEHGNAQGLKQRITHSK